MSGVGFGMGPDFREEFVVPEDEEEGEDVEAVDFYQVGIQKNKKYLLRKRCVFIRFFASSSASPPLGDTAATGIAFGRCSPWPPPHPPLFHPPL